MALGKYIKAAFANRWHLLALGGALGFGVLSGMIGVFGPLIAAAEIAYVGLLGTHPKFQRYVDAQEAKRARGGESQTVDDSLRRIMNALPRPSLQRFEALRTRCMELRQIALDLQPDGVDTGGASLEQFQLAGLDRLLWIYLRLMYTEFSLSRFFEQTKDERIQKEIERLEGRIAKKSEAKQTPHSEKILEALRDNLQTSQDRLANYHKAKENFELVQLEIERLENKIRSLSELAVNRQEPDYISGQVNEVAHSMVHTESTINELQFATGLRTMDDVPELVQRATVGVMD